MADFENQDGESHRLSLRDALLDAVEQHRDPAENVGQSGNANAGSTETDAAAAAQRARDEAGRFAKTETQPQTQTGAANKMAPPANAGAVVDGTAATLPNIGAPAIAPPSSWKKERHEAFAKLDPDTQKYILQRETEFNTGVSVYRQEAERAKSLHTALEPFMPNMQRYNVDPAAWIGTVGRVHETLLGGSPQQKLQTIIGLARDYNVDLSPITGQQPQGDGQQQQAGQLNPEMAWLRDQVQTITGQLNSFTQTQEQQRQQAEQQQQATIQTEIQQFAADGKHPHFQALWQPMAQLLESGLAQDLESAYDKALRMNDDLWKAQQADQVAQAEAERKRTAAAAAATARSKVVSVKSATPSSIAATASTAKDRRSQLAEAMASQTGGRV